MANRPTVRPSTFLHVQRESTVCSLQAIDTNAGAVAALRVVAKFFQGHMVFNLIFFQPDWTAQSQEWIAGRSRHHIDRFTRWARFSGKVTLLEGYWVQPQVPRAAAPDGGRLLASD